MPSIVAVNSDLGGAQGGHSDVCSPRLELENLVVEFMLPRRTLFQGRPRIRAVAGISLRIRTGESLGLVGESGSGKTTVGRSIVGLVRPTSGKISFNGSPLPAVGSAQFRDLRREMQMIFQDPLSSLNPYMTAGAIIGEPMIIHKLAKGSTIRRDRVRDLMREVGLNPDHYSRHPHEFSGGQRQRIGIARALAVEPSFIVADEPVSALDVSIQAQILTLLVRLMRDRKLTYLFIAHDLAVVRQVCDRVAVMYLGKLMELADTASLYGQPLHPYTQGLLAAVPVPDPDVEAARPRVIVPGDIPSAVSPPLGCVFNTRCPRAVEICRQTIPEWRNVGQESTEHLVACHLV
jgi:oligopeptide/dipeptide ABC transporter ATP-binding protein